MKPTKALFLFLVALALTACSSDPQWASLVVGRANRYGNRHNYTRRARMEIVYILALLLKKCLSFKSFSDF